MPDVAFRELLVDCLGDPRPMSGRPTLYRSFSWALEVRGMQLKRTFPAGSIAEIPVLVTS